MSNRFNITVLRNEKHLFRSQGIVFVTPPGPPLLSQKKHKYLRFFSRIISRSECRFFFIEGICPLCPPLNTPLVVSNNITIFFIIILLKRQTLFSYLNIHIHILFFSICTPTCIYLTHLKQIQKFRNQLPLNSV